jgi:Uma2 family endonuclease
MSAMTTAATSGIRLGFASAGVRMSTDEFDAVTEYDDDFGYELIHGVLVVTPIPAVKERDPNEELGYWLRSYRDNHPNGLTLDATFFEEYVRTMDSRRRADRVIWAGLGRMPQLAEDVPTIVVEFVSPGKRSWRRDYVEKRTEYSEIGVREYWVIDRFQRTLTVYLTGPAGASELLVQEQETYRTDLLPGFELPLAKLLAIADRWSGQSNEDNATP